MSIDPNSFEGIRAVCLGFAFSGLVASAFHWLVGRPLGFGLLRRGDWSALASVPLLLFGAPAVILRNTIRGRQVDHRPIAAVLVATVIAGLWSLLCGRLVLDALTLLVHA